MSVVKVSKVIDGREYSIEAGKYARFASGAVMISSGETMVLVTVVASEKEMLDIDFLPLQVEYREKMASAGKIPGGFLKREGRPSDKEILTARLIDRPCRPMFPKDWHFDTQIVAQVFSAEPDVDPENIVAVGVSAALMISDIPFNGPIAEVKVGRIDGKFILNPSIAQLETCDINMTIAGTDKSIVMVEGESKEISEAEFVSAIEYAHTQIREFNALQNELYALTSKPKRTYTVKEIPEEIINTVKNEISAELKEFVYSDTTKAERSERRSQIKLKAQEKLIEVYGENEEYTGKLEKYAATLFSKLEKQAMREMILVDGVRLDGRNTTQIRPIACETGLLPRAHGSALFTRGETQSLTTVTLGTSRDEQMIDGLLPTTTNRFYLQYNFPPFSVGETGRFGGVSRREVGHGNLAERALKIVLPSADDFGYTLRIVSDILESNGSSSMATVCAGSLALFDAGVPMPKAVSGIAMGLILEGDRYAILSDILGDEDFLGDMDFKVAGTSNGITACQMDIKIEGLSLEILTKALAQANEGRLHILGVMNEHMSTPNTEISKYAPRFTKIQIPRDTIGAVIGTGGETIRGIIKETGVEINIDDDGTVTIAATSQEASDAAQAIIMGLTLKPELDAVYPNALVKEVREGLGAIMEFMPGKQALLHISQIAHERVNNVEDYIKVGERFDVQLIEITRDGKFRLSRKSLLPRPERTESRPPREYNDNRNDNRGNDNRNDNQGNERR